jgi:hypothetical protein
MAMNVVINPSSRCDRAVGPRGARQTGYTERMLDDFLSDVDPRAIDDFFTEMARLRPHIEEANIYGKVDREAWFIICSSMDALEDTHYAILAFSTHSPHVEEATVGERYLHVYGVMQAFVVQQDAIANLAKALDFEDLVDLSPLAHIRDLRNASVGHPTLQDRPKTQPTSSHFIAQITLDHRGFELFSVSASGKEVHRYVAIPDLAREQETYVLELLRKLLARLIETHAAED